MRPFTCLLPTLGLLQLGLALPKGAELVRDTMVPGINIDAAALEPQSLAKRADPSEQPSQPAASTPKDDAPGAIPSPGVFIRASSE